MFLFVTTLIFRFISKLRFPKKVSIVTIENSEVLDLVHLLTLKGILYPKKYYMRHSAKILIVN